MVKNNLCIMLCEDFRREAAALIKTGEFPDVKAAAFPALCENPRTVIKSPSDLLPSGKNRLEHIALFCGPCVKQLKLRHKDSSVFSFHKYDQCFYMLANKEIIDNFLKAGAYILTPGSLTRLSDHAKEMKSGRKSAGKLFGRPVSRLVLLDTGTNKSTAKKLQSLSNVFDIPHEIIPVGLEHLRMSLKEIVLEWRAEQKTEAERKIISEQIRPVVSGTAERRKHKRFCIERNCLVEVNDSEMVRLKDISLSGIRLGDSFSLPPGSIHSITIFPSIKNEIRLKGLVVWSSLKEIHAGIFKHEAGLKFIHAGKDSMRLLENFLKKPKVFD